MSSATSEWSPKSREAIMEHDNTCLKREASRVSYKGKTANGKSGNGTQIGKDDDKYILSNTSKMFRSLRVPGKN